MLPKSYLVMKWTVYALATLALFALQYLLLNHIRLWGATPFLYPMLPAVLASYEGLRRGGVFGLALGLVCDLLLAGPFDGFYTVIFTFIALVSALIGENLLPHGPFRALVVSAGGLLLTGLPRVALQLLGGNTHLLLMVHLLILETVLSLPALTAIVPLYSTIHSRCATDY